MAPGPQSSCCCWPLKGFSWSHANLNIPMCCMAYQNNTIVHCIGKTVTLSLSSSGQTKEENLSARLDNHIHIFLERDGRLSALVEAGKASRHGGPAQGIFEAVPSV